jgi:hypothetical protein
MHSAGEFYNPWRLFIGCIIPNAISRSTELSSTAKLVFGKLCQYAGQNGQAYPSYKTLAGDVGVERRQAIRAVKELVDYGLIKPVGRKKGDGGFTSNIYAFLWHQTFSNDGLTDPGDKNDTRGGVSNVTTPQCHKRHHLVSDMSPKENHTRESNNEKTTTEEIRLLSDTLLSKISEKEVRVLIKRHGRDRVILAADIAAEKWRRERKEIKNPGGYLHTLCEDLVVPEWYDHPDVRKAKSEASTERKRSEARKMEEQLAKEEREAQERDDYWLALSDEEQQKFRDNARQSSPLFNDLNGAPLNAIAKLTAWEHRPQMSTNAVSSK